jgi:hypothetical protein
MVNSDKFASLFCPAGYKKSRSSCHALQESLNPIHNIAECHSLMYRHLFNANFKHNICGCLSEVEAMIFVLICLPSFWLCKGNLLVSLSS